MVADQRVEVLVLAEVDVLASAETEDQAETLELGLGAIGKFKTVRGPVHLTLLARAGLEAADGLLLGLLAPSPQPVLDRRHSTVEPLSCELLVHLHRGNVRVCFELALHERLVQVEHAPAALLGCGKRRVSRLALPPIPILDSANPAPAQTEIVGDAPLRPPAVCQRHDRVDHVVSCHRHSLSPSRGRWAREPSKAH